MDVFCDCAEWKNLKESYPELFYKDETYGWIIKWVVITPEAGNHSKAHTYGIKINYCPMCGKKILDN